MLPIIFMILISFTSSLESWFSGPQYSWAQRQSTQLNVGMESYRLQFQYFVSKEAAQAFFDDVGKKKAVSINYSNDVCGVDGLKSGE